MSGSPDYHRARCAAITRAGSRCTGGWAMAIPTLYAADPTTGESTTGPWVVLCHRHRHLSYREHTKGDQTTIGQPTHFGRRARVVHGWLGAANAWGYGTAVFARATGWTPARWFRARFQRLPFGGARRDAA